MSSKRRRNVTPPPDGWAITVGSRGGRVDTAARSLSRGRNSAATTSPPDAGTTAPPTEPTSWFMPAARTAPSGALRSAIGRSAPLLNDVIASTRPVGATVAERASRPVGRVTLRKAAPSEASGSTLSCVSPCSVADASRTRLAAGPSSWTRSGGAIAARWRRWIDVAVARASCSSRSRRLALSTSPSCSQALCTSASWFAWTARTPAAAAARSRGSTFKLRSHRGRLGVAVDGVALGRPTPVQRGAERRDAPRIAGPSVGSGIDGALERRGDGVADRVGDRLALLLDRAQSTFQADDRAGRVGSAARAAPNRRRRCTSPADRRWRVPVAAATAGRATRSHRPGR